MPDDIFTYSSYRCCFFPFFFCFVFVFFLMIYVITCGFILSGAHVVELQSVRYYCQKLGGTYGGKKEKKNGRTSWWLLYVGCHHIFGNVRIFFSFEMNGASNFGLWDTCTVGGGFFSERKKETGAGLGLGFIRNSVQKNFPSARQNVPVGIA